MPTWAVLIPIIAQYGLPFAEKMFQKWTSGNDPTQADFDELRAMAKESSADIITARLLAAGIPLDDPRAVELLALVR